jgi:hypothetical protein
MFNIITKIYRLIYQNIYEYNYNNIKKYTIPKQNYLFDIYEDNDGYLADNEENYLFDINEDNDNEENYLFDINEDNDGFIADNEESDKSPKNKIYDKSYENKNINNDDDNIMIDGLELLLLKILK